MKKRNILILILCISLFGCSKDVVNQKKINEEPNIKTLTDYVNANNGKNSVFAFKNFKCDVLNDNNILHMSYRHFILDNGELYMRVGENEGIYSNNQHCMKIPNIDLTFSLKSEYIYKGSDNQYYTITNDKDYGMELNKINISDHEDELFLKDDNIVAYKYYMEADANEYKSIPNNYYSVYVVLKKDGNLYQVVVNTYFTNFGYRKKIVSEEVVYSKEVYGFIKGFKTENGKKALDNYSEVSALITDKSYYYLKDIKTDECEKYLDVKCERTFSQSEIYNKYKDNIKYIDTEFTVLTDNNIIYTTLFEQE